MRSDVRFACFYMRPLRVVCGTEILMCEEHQELCGYALYESLLTYVAHVDLIGDPLQGTCHARASEILITKVRKISYLGFCRIFP